MAKVIRTMPVSFAESEAQGVIRLLREYAIKLRRESRQREELLSNERASRARERDVMGTSIHGFQRRVRPAILDLSRMASQMIEHGGSTDATRLELRLRLAELEYELERLELFSRYF